MSSCKNSGYIIYREVGNKIRLLFCNKNQKFNQIKLNLWQHKVLTVLPDLEFVPSHSFFLHLSLAVRFRETRQNHVTRFIYLMVN